MDLTLCGKTAFDYYRIPPQILGLYPRLPETLEDSNHLKLAACPFIADLLNAPLHRIVYNQNQRGASELYRSRIFKHELPPGSIRETDHGFRVTSPAMTLLSMAGNIPRTHLLMALYEMCGSFSVCNLNERSERLLQQALNQRLILPNEGWQRVANVDGHSTDLWKRPPILTIDELESFCAHARGFHGIKDLIWAMGNMSGITASPFEAQTSTLFSAPRCAGGEGLVIKNNQRIQLSPAARSIYPHVCCYADILIEGHGSNAGVIIECQGRSVHASEAASISDSNRTTALTSMGYEVTLLTYEQVVNEKAFDAVLDIIARKTGIKRRPKTARQLEAQSELRDRLFIDWTTLGV